MVTWPHFLMRHISGSFMTHNGWVALKASEGEVLANGGTAYFSDYSYKYLQAIEEPFEFFRDFPHAGYGWACRG